MTEQSRVKKYIDNILIGIISGVLTGVAVFFITDFFAEKRGIEIGIETANRVYVKKTESAPSLYTERLGEMIYNATPGKSDDLLVDARAIVSTRDDYRGSLIAISKLLNSEIDRLKEEIEKQEQSIKSGNAYDGEEIKRTLAVLQKKWPSKKDQIIIEIRKLLTELGLEPKDLVVK
ncbi:MULTISPECIES: hypothetical protein [unclassified Shewanella]|uniref:hypothetical protein n=1 Tax=unclassified Shewanella TaxID=196818 RepID=UPI000C824811|nr:MULTISPECIES: hypothetical protein [unclassified Shewanella]MDO6777460.1 hypothetical protein [Shewanella sp. 3_MG-2023]PMG31689.1 hypothetical protein BCU94_07010 [Shewanella sp. 10N.286.52.C2]PMH87762.1 hypothetical protein BCU57_05380 [Shewanella sp. 10N.286.48.B5]